METYHPESLLEAVEDERILPHPVLLRDVMACAVLSPAESLELQRLFHDYLRHDGEAETVARKMLNGLINTGN